MVRKSLFIALTGMLVIVLVYLVLQGRRQEKREQQVPRPVEVVKDSKPTMTRILAPHDLELVEAKTEFSGEGNRTARHHLVIRNTGANAYHSVLIKFSYLGAGDRILETKTQASTESLKPGQVRALDEIVVENLPSGALKATAKIIAADLEPEPAITR